MWGEKASRFRRNCSAGDIGFARGGTGQVPVPGEIMDKRKRILFVDDEVGVLDGLRRMLRSMREVWDLRVAASGEEGLARLEAETFDVVVSDMRMPGMDGAEFLTEVKRRHPQIVRIVLSGQSEQGMILKSVLPAHQFLSKPCDPSHLKEAISRVHALRDLLADESLIRVVSQVQTLPSPASLYRSLMEETRAKNVSIGSIAEIVSRDIGMSAKILQMVSSAFLGQARTVLSAGRAVRLIGPDTFKALVHEAGIFSEFVKPPGGFSLEALRKHSVRTAVIARSIAEIEGEDKNGQDGAFTSGVLHDVGKLVLAANAPGPEREARGPADETGLSAPQSDEETCRTTHAEVGAYLLGLWGLPDRIVEAVAYHHTPSRCSNPESRLLAAVHVADALAHGPPNPGAPESTPPLGIDTAYLERAGVSDRLPKWRECQWVRVRQRAAETLSRKVLQPI